MEGGFFRIGRFGNAPVRIHWSAPIGAFFFSGIGFYPGAWAAFILLILVHELGHALMVRAFGLHVVSIDVHGLGGVCQHIGTTTPIGRSLIAWGGVFGQAVILAIALILKLVLPPIGNVYLAQAMSTFIGTNLWLMAVNLVPIPGFDGAEAWKLFAPSNIKSWWYRRSLQKSQPKGIVRLTVDRAVELTVDGGKDLSAARKDLIERVEKATFVPPKPPEKPSVFE